MKKKIVIDCCLDCPLLKKCLAWKNLTPQQRLFFSIGVNAPKKFILKNCPLPDDLEEEK